MKLRRKLGVALALWLAAATAFAQMPPRRFQPGGPGGFDGGPQRQHAPERQNFQPQPPQREADGGGQPREPNRMSPEERRQLRRDIHDAGRDLYPERGPRRH